MKTGDRILIVYPYENIDTNPTMCLLLEELSRRGVRVDVLMRQPARFMPPQFNTTNVTFTYLAAGFFSVEHPLVVRLGMSVFLSQKKHLQSLANDLWPRLMSGIIHSNYSTIIGVDPAGIVVASRLNVHQIPLAYISFEMMFPEELNGRDRRLHDQEKDVCKHVELALLQDPGRAAFFSRHTGVPLDRIVLVPVAPPKTVAVRNDMLRRRFNIGPDIRIVLYSGSFDVWASVFDLEEMVAYWPDRFKLVVHTRNYPEPAYQQYFKKLRRTGKIFFNNEPVPRHMLSSLVSSADIGLVPYKPVPLKWTTGLNLHHIGRASGKVAYYALCGLPMLARSLPIFETDFATYCCGLTYAKTSETGKLLSMVDDNYESYSNGSFRYYEDALEPTENMQKFIEHLMNLS